MGPGRAAVGGAWVLALWRFCLSTLGPAEILSLEGQLLNPRVWLQIPSPALAVSYVDFFLLVE